MRALAAFDRVLLERVFQPVVDLSQRQPVWWARQCAVAFVVGQLVSGLRWGWGWMLALSLLLFPVFAWLALATPARAAAFGSGARFRWFVLALDLVRLALLILVLALAGSVEARQVYGVVVGACFTAMVYFSACRPPRPLLPRGRLSPV